MAIGKESDKVVVVVKKKVKERLKEIADSDGRSVSDYVSRLIEKDIQSKEETKKAQKD